MTDVKDAATDLRDARKAGRGVHMAGVAEVQMLSLEDLLQLVRERGLSLAECLALERVLAGLEQVGGPLAVSDEMPVQLDACEA